jgi:hypothetical protein
MAGQVTSVTSSWVNNNRNVKVITVTATADDTTNAFASAVIPIDGFLMRVATIPASAWASPGTSPTAAYDIHFTDSDNCDVSGTNLHDRSATASENWIISDYIYVAGNLTVAIDGNSVASARTKIVIYVQK